MSEKVWIVGGHGRIGREIESQLDPLNYNIISTGTAELDISKIDDVFRYVELFEPSIIINSAALTNVKQCESEPEHAFKVNAQGAKNLAIAANNTGVKLIHMSTDDVYYSQKQEVHSEFDPVSPQTVYGRTKAIGEDYIREFCNKYFIIRSSWTYDFITLRTVLSGLEKGHIKVAGNQVSSPTSVYSLVKFIIFLMDRRDYGLYHFSSMGSVSRIDFIKEVARLTDNEEFINNMNFENVENNLRPIHAILDSYILRMTGLYEVPQWTDDLQNMVRIFKEKYYGWKK